MIHSVPGRLRTSRAVGVGLAVALLSGCAATTSRNPPRGSPALLIEGRGRAITSLRPPGETFSLTAKAPDARSFKVVPPGKMFILTDVMYIAQGSLRESVVVNLARTHAEEQGTQILFQVRIAPGESDDVHLQSGYVIPAGHSLVAYTNAGMAPDQHVSIAVTGYLTDEFARGVTMTPGSFHGKWAADAEACAAISHESQLTIRADAVDFYESRGKLIEVTSSSPQRMTVRLQLTGEGNTWRSTREFKLSPDGGKLGEVGGSLRMRCR